MKKKEETDLDKKIRKFLTSQNIYEINKIIRQYNTSCTKGKRPDLKIKEYVKFNYELLIELLLSIPLQKKKSI